MNSLANIPRRDGGQRLGQRKDGSSRGYLGGAEEEQDTRLGCGWSSIEARGGPVQAETGQDTRGWDGNN